MLILESYRACSYCVLMAVAVLEGSGFAVLSEHRVTRTTCVSSTIANKVLESIWHPSCIATKKHFSLHFIDAIIPWCTRFEIIYLTVSTFMADFHSNDYL